MNERENIFGRIREALRVQAPVPGAHPAGKGGAKVHTVSEAEAAKHIHEWLPPVGETFEQHAELFRANALDLRAEFHLLDDVREMEDYLRGLAASEGWITEPETSRWPLRPSLRLRSIRKSAACGSR